MKLIFCFIALFLLSNCTIQKRTFNKGYFVQWNWKKSEISFNENIDSLNSSNKNIILHNQNNQNTDGDLAYSSIEQEPSNFEKVELKIIENTSKNKTLFDINKTSSNDLKVKDQKQDAINKHNVAPENKTKKSLSRTFFLISILFLSIFILSILIAVINPLDFFNYLYFISMLAFTVFILLALIFETINFYKRKKQKTNQKSYI